MGKPDSESDLLARIREVDQLKARLLATVSHELRTPLTSVLGYAEMLLEGLAGPLGEGPREYVLMILEKAEQLLETINALLDLSHIEGKGLSVVREPVHLAELIELCAATVRPRAARKGLILHVDCSPLVGFLDGDREKLRQVLMHLLGNAIKFTPEGGRITVGAAPEESEKGATSGRVRLWVCDTGVGIDPQLRERIFEPFFQADGSSTREYGGTGLGLAVVKAFVDAHEGGVRVESEPGRGSTFHVSLPTRR